VLVRTAFFLANVNNIDMNKESESLLCEGNSHFHAHNPTFDLCLPLTAYNKEY
jgi:hypothetical protein